MTAMGFVKITPILALVLNAKKNIDGFVEKATV
jgi:hypothetical protein